MSEEIRLVEMTCPHCGGAGCEQCEWVGIWGAPVPQSTPEPDGQAGTLTGDLAVDMAAYAVRLKARAETAEAELAETRQRLALALDALASAIEAADTGRSPDQERIVLHELRAPHD